jgi:hypothetical protein
MEFVTGQRQHVYAGGLDIDRNFSRGLYRSV